MIQQISIMAIPLLLAIILHEVAHGWVANRLGDPTAKRAGRLTLNPILTEGVGAEARVWRQLSFVLQQETYTSPFHTGTRLLDGTVVELALGFNFAWDRFLLQLGAIDNVSPVVAAADFTLLGRVTYRRGS